MRLLVIDDDASIRDAIDALMKSDTCDVVQADSVRRGAEELEKSPFDLVMVDIFMPEMNGLEAIKDFRKRAPNMPIVAMSGFRFRNPGIPMPDFLKIAADLGATRCLKKPFRPQQLFEAIEACRPMSA